MYLTQGLRRPLQSTPNATATIDRDCQRSQMEHPARADTAAAEG